MGKESRGGAGLGVGVGVRVWGRAYLSVLPPQHVVPLTSAAVALAEMKAVGSGVCPSTPLGPMHVEAAGAAESPASSPKPSGSSSPADFEQSYASCLGLGLESVVWFAYCGLFVA